MLEVLSEMEVSAFAGELRQIFANLLGNSIDAVAMKGADSYPTGQDYPLHKLWNLTYLRGQWDRHTSSEALQDIQAIVYDDESIDRNRSGSLDFEGDRGSVSRNASRAKPHGAQDQTGTVSSVFLPEQALQD